MLFKETGNKSLPTIILIHGGGLSWWSLKSIVEQLKEKYHIVTPIIDGHGENGNETFISIENSAKKLINYIDGKYSGKVYAIGGLSIGAQIVTEALSLRSDIADYAIIESALVYPIRGMTSITVPMCKLSYGLIKNRWFSKLQAKTLYVPEEMFEQYYKDSLKITKRSLINITLSNGNYNLKSLISNTKSKVLVILGEKETNIMKKSGKRLHEVIVGSELYIASNMGHGEISLLHPEKYVKLIEGFFSKNNGTKYMISDIGMILNENYGSEKFFYKFIDYVTDKEIEEGIDKLNIIEKNIFMVGNAIMEVNNGGFDQYLFNTEGVYVEDTLGFLHEINEVYFSNLLEKAISIYKSDSPNDKKHNEFNELDKEFYDMDSTAAYEELYDRCINYLKNNIKD